MLLYLDQNYASRVAKYLIGQKSHDHFGALHRALETSDGLVPPSPFHVLETRGGYLLPTLKEIYARFSQGYWVRPWLEVVARQVDHDRVIAADLLTREGDWETPAVLDPLGGILSVRLDGPFLERARRARIEVAARLGLEGTDMVGRPFFWLLSRFLAFRSLDAERYPRESDLTDLVMAATIAPYVEVLATDRYMRELMQRVGHPGRVFSGRRHEVEAMTAFLQQRSDSGAPRS